MKKPLLNKLVKLIAKKQNAKHKMNAGQIREFIKCYVQSMTEIIASEKDMNNLTKELASLI